MQLPSSAQSHSSQTLAAEERLLPIAILPYQEGNREEYVKCENEVYVIIPQHKASLDSTVYIHQYGLYVTGLSECIPT